MKIHSKMIKVLGASSPLQQFVFSCSLVFQVVLQVLNPLRVISTRPVTQKHFLSVIYTAVLF